MKKIPFSLRVTGLAILCLTLCFTNITFAENAPPPPPQIGDVAPDFAFTDLDGKEHHLSDLRGKAVLLDIWATWCGPCIGEIPTLRAIHQEMAEKDFVVLSVSIDAKLETAKNYVTKNDMPWMHGHATGEWKSEPVKKYQVKGIPSVWLIDAEGIIRAINLRGEQAKIAARLLSERKLTLAPDPAVTVTGRVMDDAGQPVAGAKVLVYAYRGGDIAKGFLAKNIKETFTTDANGVWTCEKMFSDAAYISIGGYHYDYDCSVNGFFEMQKFDAENRGAFYDGQTKIILQRGFKVSGVVKDGDGKPIPNVPVFLGADSGSLNGIPPRKTDEHGTFSYTIRGVTHDGNMTFGIKFKGYAPMVANVPISEARKGCEIILKPPQTLKGIVVDSDGKPLEKVWICIDGYNKTWLLGSQVVYSKKDGSFEFKNMPEDEVEFGFSLKNYASKRDVSLKAGDENKVVLLPPTRVVATVVDAETNASIKKFSVDRGIVFSRGSISWGSNKPGHGDYTEIKQSGDGSFENELIYGTRGRDGYVFRVSADGYFDAESERVVMDGKTHSLVFKLKKGAPRHLTVTTATGEAAADAEVFFNTGEKISFTTFFLNGKIDRTMSNQRAMLKTDAAGTVTIPPLKTSGLIVTHSSGWAKILPQNLSDGMTIKLAPWERITGKIFEGKNPNAGATVSYRFDDYFPGYERQGWVIWDAIAVADKDGAFEITHALPGSGWLHNKYVRAQSAEIYIEPGKTAEVNIGGSGRPLVGKVVGLPEGENAEQVTVFGKIHLADEKWKMEKPAPLGDDEWEGDIDDETAAKEAEAERQRFIQRNREWKKRSKEKFFQINFDGTFRIDGVLSGKYLITVSRGYLQGEQIVEVTLDDGETYMDEPKEVAPIVLHDLEKAKVGDAFPDLIFRDGDGKEHHLSEYRGKYVLVYVWNAKKRDGRKRLSAIQSLREQYKDNDHLVILLLNTDEKQSLAQRYIEEKNILGPHFFLNKKFLPELENRVTEDSQYSTVRLIDPAGKTLDKSLWNEALIDAALQKHLPK